MNTFTSRYMFVNAMLMSCCSSLISSESCLGSEDESLLSGTCMESTLQVLETRLKANPLQCPLGWKEFAHHCYNFITTKRPWNEAEVYYSDLDNSFWLGAADFTEGDWIWTVDFSNVIFTDWRSGQPDNNKESEDCLQIEKIYQYKWNDAPCSTAMPYICESEKGGARISYSKPFPR